MTRIIGTDAALHTRKLITSDKPPKLLLLGGPTGAGKSTTAMHAAHRMGFSRVLSTDAIREILRCGSDAESKPALFRSSFSRGEVGDPVVDWLDTCLALEAGIEATNGRARREGIDLLLEGVHLTPENKWLRQWREAGGLAVGVLLHIENPDSHAEMLRSREAHSWRRAERYIASLDRMRAIQTGMLDRTSISDWVAIDPSVTSDTVTRIEHLFDVEWNRRDR